MTESPTTVTVKPGSVLTSRVREVCRECNSGWMSRLESSAAPLLRRIWAETYPFGRTAFTPEEVGTLATWAVKTAWIRELVTDSRTTATPAMRLHLRTQQLPPDFVQVWVARYEGESDFGVLLGQLLATHKDEPWNSGSRRHVALCAMTFRGISILVRTDDGWGVPPMDPPGALWRHFWPVSQPVQWPPAAVARDQDVRDAIVRYDWMQLPEVGAFHRDRSGVQRIIRN